MWKTSFLSECVTTLSRHLRMQNAYLRLWVRRGFTVGREQLLNEEVIGQDDNLLNNSRITIKKLDNDGGGKCGVLTHLRLL